MRTLSWLLLVGMCAACWQPRYFSPREYRNGTGPDGHDAAFYRIVDDALVGADVDDGEVVAEEPGVARARGELRVWSAGAKARFDENDEEVVDLHVGFELENLGDIGLELDVESVQVEELHIDGLLCDPLGPFDIAGSGYASPGTTTRVDLVFRPPTMRPRRVDGFTVSYSVYDGEGREVRQQTPFGPAVRRSRGSGSAYWGWGPFWGGYWGPAYGRYGFGVGYRWNRCW